MANINKARRQLRANKPEKKPYYSSTPQVSDKKLANNALSQNPSLGNNVPGIVPQKQAQTSGLGLGAPQKKPPHGFGHPVALKTGPLRLSGHKGAHRIGGFGSAKSTIK